VHISVKYILYIIYTSGSFLAWPPRGSTASTCSLPLPPASYIGALWMVSLLLFDEYCEELCSAPCPVPPLLCPSGCQWQSWQGGQTMKACPHLASVQHA